MSKVLERYTVPREDGSVQRMRYVSRIEWRNIGIFWFPSMGEVGLSTPWGNLIAANWLPFEYRYGNKRPLLRVGKINLRWVRLKRMEHDT